MSQSLVQKRDGQELLPISWNNLQFITDELIKTIERKQIKFNSVYPIPRGGLMVALMLSHKFDVPLLMREDDICKDCLICDDIVDSGKTLEYYRRKFPKNNVATLHVRSTASSKPDVWAFEIMNTSWVHYPWEKR